MNEALDERVLEASVAAALERIRKERQNAPDQRLNLHRELSLIETRLHHLVELIANGNGSETIINSLHAEEVRKKAVINELARMDQDYQVLNLDAKRVVNDLRKRLEDMPALLSRHIPQARQLLKKLLDGNIMCEPIVDENGKQGYQFTATGTFDRLLSRIKVGGESATYSGGGQGSLPSLTDPLNLTIQGLAFIA